MYKYQSRFLSIYVNEKFTRLEFTKYVTVWFITNGTFALYGPKIKGFGMSTWWTPNIGLCWTTEKQSTRFQVEYTGSMVEPWHRIHVRLLRLCFSLDMPKFTQSWLDKRNNKA